MNDVIDAPELIEVRLAHVALESLEMTLQIMHGNAVTAERPPTAAMIHRVTDLLDLSQKLRMALRTYRRSALRLVRSNHAATMNNDF